MSLKSFLPLHHSSFVAKNVILAGVRSVSLLDPQLATLADCSAHFYINQESIGHRRDECCLKKLAELNEYVPVSILSELSGVNQLNEAIISKYQVVVVTEQTLSTQLEINQLCHPRNIAFIQADVRGLCAQAFCDFGSEFYISDPTGEAPIVGLVGGITQEAEGVVTCVDDIRHGLEDGDFITFREVKGMKELNGCSPRRVSVKGPFTFSIGDTSTFHAYETGGVFEQVKQPKIVSFAPLKEALSRLDKMVVSDYGKIDRQPQLHLAFQALSAFRSKHQGSLPIPHNEADSNEFIILAKNAAKELGLDVQFDEQLMREFAFTCVGQLAPMCAFLGGLVAQEVLKACSGKFHPIDQFFYFDALECLPRGEAWYNNATPEEFLPTGSSRYSGQIAVFGTKFQERLASLKGFIVGAGAIGCELLKLFALMGVGTAPAGAVHVTDMDTIEKSNLNRQFLFRPWDVSKPKSRTAADAVCNINPDLKGHIHPRLDRVGPETEDTFGDAFYEPLDFVANALDNMEARKYVDRRCVFYRKPLLESGTLGTKGNTQVVVPHLTESYSSSQDPPEKTIPFCTLHNFPNSIEHTIQWAMDCFHGLFRGDAEAANLYLSTPEDFKRSLLQPGQGHRERLERVLKALESERPMNFEDCVTWARLKFEEFFANNIKQLLFNFPRDAKTSSGALFWSGPKRAPGPIMFSIEDPLHLDFIIAAANLRAENYGLKGTNNAAYIKTVLSKVIVPEFQPRSGVAIQVSDNEPVKSSASESSNDIGELLHALPTLESLVGFKLHPIEFEKDNDTNWHVTFVTATANLRATNYEITTATRHAIKQIAGKIIPAIATTTAVVAGLVGLELYKLTAGPRTSDRFKNGFVNLALPFTAFSEPLAAPKARYGNTEWTLWDRFEVTGDLKLSELIEHFRTQHGINITMLSHGSSMLFGFIRSKEVIAERLQMPISKLVESVAKKPLPAYINTLVLEMLAEDLEGNDIEVPYILIKFRAK